MNKIDTEKLFTQLKEVPILVVGDIMLDEFHWCKVTRISPEAPVPICNVERTTLVPGGGGNVAVNIKSLGGTPYLVGILGKDSSGEKLKQVLSDHNINTTHLIVSDEKPTILKSRIIAHHQHVTRVDRENCQKISDTLHHAINTQVDILLDRVKIVLLSDYQKGTLTEALTQTILKKAAERQVPVVIDPKGRQYSKYKGATVLTPNFNEFKEAVQRDVETEDEILEAALTLIAQLDLTHLLITRSEKGMSVISKSGEKVDIPTVAREVFDVTGAGDTSIAMFSLALGSGLSCKDATILSNLAAGIVVEKLGTATTTRSEILAHIHGA